jgi:integrase
MSRNVQLASNGQITRETSLAELRARVLADETLPEVRRGEMASALRSLAKALGRPAETIAADPQALRAAINGLTPAMVGMKAGRWRNVLSLVSACLAHFGLVVVQGRIRAAPATDWLAILSLLATGPGEHFHLWRFARYCTQIGIMPDQVSDAVLARYEDDLTSGSLACDPKRAAREVARYWNQAAKAHPTWPQRQLNIPDNRNTYAPPLDAYPESLINDVEAWCAGLGEDDPFADRPFKALKAASVATRRKQLRLLLGALVSQGVNPVELVDLAAVVTPARAELALRFFWEKAGRKATHHTYHLASIVLMIARHWVRGLPEPDVKRLAAMAAQLRPDSSGMSGRNMTRLRQLEDPTKLLALVNLPALLAAEATRLGPPSIHTARLVQTAVLLELLLHIPMRMANLRGLRIGIHLLRGPKNKVAISVPAHEVKNDVGIEASLSRETAKLLALYINHYLPLLVKGESDYLFPGERPDSPKTYESLRSQIEKVLAQRIGIRFNPHSFRHLAAYITLKHNPGGHGLVQRVLGHKSLHSTMSFYSGLETPAALEAYDELISGQGETTRPLGKPRSGRRRGA